MHFHEFPMYDAISGSNCVQVGLLHMVCNLPSRVFSSETLVAGVSMVERAEGLPDKQSTQELLEELAKLEVP